MELSNQITGFEEKPANQYLMCMGVYKAKHRILDNTVAGQTDDFDALIIGLIPPKHPVLFREFDGYCLDIFRHEDYKQARGVSNIARGKFLQ